MSNKIQEILSEVASARDVKQVDVSKMKYEWHEVSKIEPLMNESDYSALLNDVKLVGAIHTPVVLYNGKIVDGRHRQRVAIELNKHLPVLELSDTYDISDISEAIRSLSMRRNKSKTQKEIQAFRYKQMVKNVSYLDAAAKYGVTEKSVMRITTMFNNLRRAGFESDFTLVLTKFEYGLNVNPKDFVWLDKVTGTPYGCITQLKNYQLRLQEAKAEDLNDIDITEVNPITGECLNKEDNAYLKKVEDKAKYFEEKYTEALTVIEKLTKRLDSLERELKELKEEPIDDYRVSDEETAYILKMNGIEQ